MDGGRRLGIYIHIPFCKTKCPYCDFNSSSVFPVPEKEYVGALLREFSFIAEREELKGQREVETVYLGGGTPSLFSPHGVGRILDGIAREITLSNNAEKTLEVNPDTVTPEKLKGFKDSGINRLSIGVQSFNPGELKNLGRTHSGERAEMAFFEARDAGFENIGLDLMFAVPGQTLKGWERSISKTIGLGPEHVSMYGLTIEEGTPYHNSLGRNLLKLPTERTEVTMWVKAIEMFKGSGYRHYEISNLALPGFESRHNTNYWLREDYIGLGAGAHSYLNRPGWGRRWWNEEDAQGYMELVNRNGTARAGFEKLSKDEAALEALFLGLRLMEGIRKDEFRRRFGKCPSELLRWKRLSGCGLVKSAGKNVALTEKGILFSNEVF